MITTEFVVSDRIDFRLRLLQRNQQKSFTFIRPQYIFNCIKAQILIPLSPIYLTVLPIDKKQYYLSNFDKFGDSYTTFTNRRQLDQILAEMQDEEGVYLIDKRLQQKLELKRSRHDKKSLCFGVDDLQVIKLKMFGNKIVDNFSDQPNSIIVGRSVSHLIMNKINNYLLGHP